MSVRSRIRAERGSLLIEVMVGAVLVVLASTAALKGFDGAFKSSGSNKARSVASTLAEQDQERLRSFRALDLNNLDETRTVNVKGVPYEVHSEADWVRDQSGIVSCNADTTAAEYMKITSSVDAEMLKSPVKSESLYAPPVGELGANRGTMAVQVVDRMGEPIEGIRVDLSGTAAESDNTNELGCAVFGAIPEGPYDITLPDTSRVGWNGTAVLPGSVVAGETSLFILEYDHPATLNVSFETQAIGASAPTDIAWNQVSIGNARIPDVPAIRLFDFPSAMSYSVGQVFPFTGGYDVFAGDCIDNNPSTHDVSYFDNHAGHVSTDPNGTYSVKIRVPTLRVTVMDTGGGSPRSGARVYLRPDDPAACGPAYLMGTTDSAGRIALPQPFGLYDICADRSASGNRLATHMDFAHTNRDGGQVTITLSNSGSDCFNDPW